MKVIGIIPARGGSKGVLRKNIRIVAGEPLIAYAVKAARESELLTAFIVSTDDKEIAGIAGHYGSPVFIRPPKLAQDDSPMVATVQNALEYAEKKSGKFDAIVLIQPTSPIRTGSDIDAVIRLLGKDSAVEGVISVCPMQEIHPARMYRLNSENQMESIHAELETRQRQDLPTVYYRNGALYAVQRSVLFEQNTLMPQNKKAYIMPLEHLANIDDERDLIITDTLVRLWKEKNDGNPNSERGT